MFTTLSLVALGGAIGASLRWLMGVAVLRATGPAEFPVAILSANVLGSFLMGVFVVVAAHKGLTHLSPFVMTGLLGAFDQRHGFKAECRKRGEPA
ncbi:MAG: CrcB family protein, partial [Pseudomonadota bacterium]